MNASDLDLKYPTAPKSHKQHRSFIEGVCKENIEYANIALDHYNVENHTEYKLVEDETLTSTTIHKAEGSWIHCGFHAKASSTLLFFAEIDVLNQPNLVTTCQIVQRQSETRESCNPCHCLIVHPVDGYVGACPDMNHYGPPVRAIAEIEKTLLLDKKNNRWTAPIFSQEMLERYKAFKKKTAATQTRGRKGICEGHRKQNIKSANIALDHYNNKNHTQYVLVEDDTLASNAFLSILGCMIHCSFHAMGSSSNLFFAEVKLVDESKTVVTACKILDGETRNRCNHCRTGVIHPVDGYLAGCPKNNPPSDPEKEKAFEAYRSFFDGMNMTGPTHDLELLEKSKESTNKTIMSSRISAGTRHGLPELLEYFKDSKISV
ncbi:hypothetical protein LIER_15090 [Lithospermum erythrorhizon]|uniref:DUF3615 domain-containing protein n=1 Tax=Lithospermum erythrorhizon TaxID=34254 RepID=A0AAV3Q416_LITER